MKHTYLVVALLLCLLYGLRGRAQAEIMASFESPAQNQPASGISVISGWAFSTTAGAQITVQLRIDGGEPSLIPCCGERRDVSNRFSSSPQALTSGFGQVFNFNLLSDGLHTVTVEVQDDAGGTFREEHQITVVRPGGFAFLSSLSLLVADASIENQQVVLEEVGATDKATNETRTVKLRLAWQVNTQSLGIVAAETTSSTTQSVKQALKQQTTDTIAAQTVGTTSDPLISNLENPPETRTVSGLGVVSGWTFPPPTGATIASVRLRLDGTTMGPIPCCSARQDVATAYPDFPQALQSGFGLPFNFNLLTSGSHSVGIEVQSSAGAPPQTIDHQVSAIKLGGFEFIDNFDLTNALASINNTSLFLENVNIRDKATGESKTIAALFAWQDSCQCFIAQGNCGNGSIESIEECDGTTFRDAACSSLGFTRGTLTCLDTCQVTTTECEGGPRVYVTNVLSNTVSVLDTADNTVSATIRVGKEPRGIAFKPDGTVAYVSNFRDNTVSVVDPSTNTVTGSVTVGKGPTGVAFAPDGTKAYVVNGLDDTVSVINTTTREIMTNIAVGREPQNIALFDFLDGTQRGYVTNFSDNSVTVLDTLSDTVVGDPIAVQEGPDGLALTPDGKKIYVANFADDSVSVITTQDNAVVKTLTSDDGVGLRPVKVALSPDGRRAYVSASLGIAVNAIDTAADTVVSGENLAIGFVDEEPEGIVITPRGLRAYVTVYGRNGNQTFVLVFSTVTQGLVTAIEVGEGPFALAIGPPSQ